MTTKELTLTLQFNEHGCPIKNIPDGAWILLKVSTGATEVGADKEGDSSDGLREVEIVGNAEGLRALAQQLLAIAEVATKGYHEHLDAATYPKYFRSPDDWGLTVTHAYKPRKRR